MQVPAGTTGALEEGSVAADVETDVAAVVLEPLLPQAVSAISPAVRVTAATERRVQLFIAREGNGSRRRIGLGRVGGHTPTMPGRSRTVFPVRFGGVPTWRRTCNPFGR